MPFLTWRLANHTLERYRLIAVRSTEYNVHITYIYRTHYQGAAPGEAIRALKYKLMLGGKTFALATLALMLAASMVRAQHSDAQRSDEQSSSAQESTDQKRTEQESAEPEGNGKESAKQEFSAQESIEAILAEEDPALQEIEAQIQAQEFDYPILWLEQQIAAVEHTSHRYDAELIRPLTLLGDARAGKGDFPGALDSYERAVHLSRVNGGLVGSDQIPIVYREANTYKAMGDYASANDREEYAYYVLTNAHGPYDEEMLAGVFHLANWYSETESGYRQVIPEVAVRDKVYQVMQRLETRFGLDPSSRSGIAIEGQQKIANATEEFLFAPRVIA